MTRTAFESSLRNRGFSVDPEGLAWRQPSGAAVTVDAITRAESKWADGLRRLLTEVDRILGEFGAGFQNADTNTLVSTERDRATA